MKIQVMITTTENASFLNCDLHHIIEVEFEDYVATVVASEIGNAPIEACKAMAIAARTFAVSRGVLEGKVISDSASVAQAYRAVRTNYENCNRAARETAGQVLTYHDKIISAVYCDSNGGRTVSSEKKWGGVHPYLIEKDDPWTKLSGKVRNGHGVGLSQAGAIYAANNDVDFQNIIKFYYPGTEIIEDYGNKEIEYQRKVLEEVKTRVEIAMNTIKKGLE